MDNGFNLAAVTYEVMHSGTPARLLANVTTDFQHGGISAVAGVSGAGKSTLLRLLVRLDDPSSGTISFQGKRLTDFTVRDLRRQVSLLPQEAHLLGLTVEENLELPARLRGETPPDAGGKRRLLEQVGLTSDMLSRREGELSVGQKQRVCMCRALAGHPQALLLDEPTSALDPAAAEALGELIRTLSCTLNLTVVVVTHSLALLNQLDGKLLFLAGGRVAEQGDLRQSLSAPGSDELRSFLEVANHG